MTVSISYRVFDTITNAEPITVTVTAPTMEEAIEELEVVGIKIMPIQQQG